MERRVRAAERVGCAAALIWVLAAAPAASQTAPVPAPEPSATVEPTGQPAAQPEILVTARRRTESLENVPISITALSRDTIAQRQIQTEADLQTAVPGLTIRENGSANQFNYALRGQSVDTYSGSPPGVLPYIDEAQIVTRSATLFYDLDGIQVLKGPQGTLFGRNATGGAVLFTTAKPGDATDGYIQARYGSFDLLQTEAAATLRLGEAGGLRLAGAYTRGGAFVRNLATGRRLGRQDIGSGRATLLLRPIEGLTNTLVVQHTEEGGNNVPTEVYSAYGCGQTFNGVPLNTTGDCFYGPLSPPFQAFVAAHPNLFPGGVDAAANRQRALGPWRTDVNVPLFHDAAATFAINTTEWAVADGLTVKNIFAWNRSRADDGFDYDGTPYPIFQTGGTPTPDATSVTDPAGFIQRTRQVSDELQLQGKAFANALTYVVGGYFLDQRDINDSNLFAFDFSPIFSGQAIRYHQRSRTTSRALFAQGTYALTPKLNLTGGLRWTWETSRARQLAGSVFGTAFPDEKLKSDKPSWTVSVDYRVTPDLLVYVAHRGSWRAGGYNYSVTPLDATAADGGNRFGPETTRDVEAGFKYSGRGLGVPATLNVAAYNQWVDNIQRAAYVVGVGDTASIVTANVPGAQITGAEADLSIRPAAWLSLGGSVAYTHARYTDRVVDLFGVPTLYGPFADAPRWSGTLYAEASHRLSGDTGRLALRADLFAQSRFFFSNVAATQAPETAIAGYALVNLRLSLADIAGSGVSAAVFARNLFDKRYYAGGNSLGPTLGLNTSVPGRPRMIGGELRFGF